MDENERQMSDKGLPEHNPEMHSTKCERCHGTGLYSVYEYTCKDCGGAGIIPKETMVYDEDLARYCPRCAIEKALAQLTAKDAEIQQLKRGLDRFTSLAIFYENDRTKEMIRANAAERLTESLGAEHQKQIREIFQEFDTILVFPISARTIAISDTYARLKAKYLKEG